MKQNITKLLTALLAIVLVVGLLPATALAATEYDVWVGGVQVSDSNRNDVLGDGTVVFTPATGSEPAKLALYNATFTSGQVPGVFGDYVGIYSEIDLTLELHRTNTITPAKEDKGFSYGIIQVKDLVIVGDGTLNVTSAAGSSSYAVDGGKMTMRGGTVRVTAGSGYDCSEAFYASEFTMEGGTLEVTATSGYRQCRAFGTNKLTMLGGTIRATAGDTTEESVAVSIDKFTMEGGTLEATVDNSESSYAVRVFSEMTVLDGTIRATGGGASGNGAAIYSRSFVMEGGTLEATAGKGKTSYAFDAGNMTVRGGTIRATAVEESNNSFAVSSRKLVMEGGTLEATADKGKFTCGVNADSMTVLRGAIQATAGSASNYCKGVSAGEFTMEGGSLFALGGEAPESWGADVKGAITGGTLTVFGQTDAFNSAPDPSGYTYSAVTVNTELSEIGASAWNGADKLSGEGDFKYVKIAPHSPFTDVTEGQYYYEPVLWAVGQDPQITTGTSADKFSPNATCTRAQVVTFLWRAMGEPLPMKADNPFTDVKEGQYYYKAVLWAVEKGITTGTSATTFSPDSGCTRGQVVTFLHRAQGTPAPGSSVNPFTDVPAGQYYYDAVLWAVNHAPQITNGTSATTFSPGATCTRGQIVTFLYRAMA